MLAQLLIVGSLSLLPGAVAPDATVVFVCEHGAAKSVIASAYFNKIAAEKGLRARAVYRGVNPDPSLSATALKGLRDDGLTVPADNPSTMTQNDVDTASVIFAIGCTLPKHAVVSGKTDSWEDVPGDKGYAAMRDAIRFISIRSAYRIPCPAIGCAMRMFHMRPMGPTGRRRRKNT